VCRIYADCNQLLGDIVKVTPTSKAVGDMALFLVANDLTAADVMKGDRELAFPRSVLDLLGGRMGQVDGGFPRDVRDRILRGEKPMEGRPGESMPPADLAATRAKVAEMVEEEPTNQDVVSYLMYPQVFEQLAEHQRQFADVSVLPTPIFLYGMIPGEEIAVDIEPGKTLIIKFLTVGEARPDGTRSVFFELNGQPREVTVTDHSLQSVDVGRLKADPKNAKQIGAMFPGLVIMVAVKPGDQVVVGQKLAMLEAMKMEATISAQSDGEVAEVHVIAGTQVETGDLLITLT
jgi:pyruvate carboxylase